MNKTLLMAAAASCAVIGVISFIAAKSNASTTISRATASVSPQPGGVTKKVIKKDPELEELAGPPSTVYTPYSPN